MIVAPDDQVLCGTRGEVVVVAGDNNGHDDSLPLFLSFAGYSMHGVKRVVGV